MACSEAPGLVIEKNRLAVMGVQFLGIIGDQNHDYGYHLCKPPAGDYSRDGVANQPVGDYACAIDIDMRTFPAGREWLAWLITEIREDRITGMAEVIGSFNGRDVRYWSDIETPQWQQEGVPYTGSGHDVWVHAAVYRSSALLDHGLLAGWTANGLNGGGTTVANGYEPLGYPASMLLGGKERGVGLQTADNWAQEHFGHSPYDAPGKFTESYRSARLRRTEENTQKILEREQEPLELDDADIVAIADQVAAKLGDDFANRVADVIAARMQQ